MTTPPLPGGRDARHLAAAVAIGLVAKLAATRTVAVNGDTGLYIYDATQLLRGETMFVDFPSRSPVFEHLLALAIYLGDSPLLSVRAVMVGISVGLGVAIYVLARQIFDHRAGIAAALLFYLTPLPLVWGVWVKTEQAATLVAICGFIAALAYIDRERIPPRVVAGIGVAFGVAFLIRRVAIVYIGAFALFVLWYRHRDGHTLRSTLSAATGALVAAGATLAAAYLLLASGDLATAARIADVHAVALFESAGQGGLGWVEIPGPRTAFMEERGGVFSMLCQKCGTNTTAVFAQTAWVVAPAAVLALVPMRSWLRAKTLSPIPDVVAPAVLATPLLYFTAIYDIDPDILAPALLGVGVLAVWFTEPVDWRRYWRPTAMLPLAVLLALAAGYLYRDRILYVTYFQDLFPFLAILAGGAAVAWLSANHGRGVRALFAILLVSGAAAGGVHAYPYTDVTTNLETDWFTPELVDAYGEDMDARTGGDGRTFVAQPLYLVGGETRPLADLSRKFYVFRGWPNSTLKHDLEVRIAAALHEGAAHYVVDDVNMVEITKRSPHIRRELANHYCEVDAPLYNRTGATLLAHESTGECS